MVNSPPSFFTVSESPTRTSRAGFAGRPLEVIRPNSHECVARVRVLKNRAAHNHLSMRIPPFLLDWLGASILDRFVEQLVHLFFDFGPKACLLIAQP